MVPGDPLERLTNLVARLVHSARPLSQAEIVAEVPGYTSGEAGRRAFERDKRVLRDQGVPLREEGGRYSIPPEEFFLPDLDLTDQERSALAVAIAAVPVGGGVASDAIGKLGGLGALSDMGGVLDAVVHADLEDVPTLSVLHGAARRRALVEFRYAGEARTVEPYAVFFWERYWYLFGYDRSRSGQRTFRVDRVEDGVAVGDADSFERPDDLDVAAALPRGDWRSLVDEPVEATVALDPVVAGKVRAEVGPAATGANEAPDGRTLLRMQVSNRALFRSWLLGLLDHAEVIEPADLRAEVADWLRAIASRPG